MEWNTESPRSVSHQQLILAYTLAYKCLSEYPRHDHHGLIKFNNTRLVDKIIIEYYIAQCSQLDHACVQARAGVSEPSCTSCSLLLDTIQRIGGVARAITNDGRVLVVHHYVFPIVLDHCEMLHHV